MIRNSIIILIALVVLSCHNKKEKVSLAESAELKEQIDSIEATTEEIKNTEKSIEASIDKIDKMLNEIEN